MARIDMSPKAVTVRLARTSQLRRLCLELRQRSKPTSGSPAPKNVGAGEGTEAAAEGRERYETDRERSGD